MRKIPSLWSGLPDAQAARPLPSRRAGRVLAALPACLLLGCAAAPRFAAWELPASSRFEEKADHFVVQNDRCEQTRSGVVFYPGGLVSAAAYIPLAAALAQDCHLVLIAKMPLSLAVLAPDAGLALQRQYADRTRLWVLGGHSLGGAMAAQLAKKAPQFKGLFLLAAYPPADSSLAASPLPVLSISASQDGLATPAKIDDNKRYLPPTTEYVVIQGGNHAQFGDYGPQDKDGQATISAAEQLRQTRQAVLAWLGRLASGVTAGANAPSSAG